MTSAVNCSLSSCQPSASGSLSPLLSPRHSTPVSPGRGTDVSGASSWTAGLSTPLSPPTRTCGTTYTIATSKRLCSSAFDSPREMRLRHRPRPPLPSSSPSAPPSLSATTSTSPMLNQFPINRFQSFSLPLDPPHPPPLLPLPPPPSLPPPPLSPLPRSRVINPSE